MPLTPRDSVSPAAVTLTLPANEPPVVGWKRTTTFWVAAAARVNEPPETMRNGALTLTLPDSDAPLVFCTVKVRSTLPPAATVPKLTEVVGVTLMSACATPLAVPEHALSLPL